MIFGDETRGRELGICQRIEKMICQALVVYDASSGAAGSELGYHIGKKTL